MTAMMSRDYDEAFSYIWKRAGRCSKDYFLNSVNDIYTSLGATSITFPEYDIIREDDKIFFSYTISYNHGDEFSVQSSNTVRVIKEEGIYYLQYNDNMLLEGYKKGSYILYNTLRGNRGQIYTSDKTAVAINSYSPTVAIRVSDDLNINQTINQIALITGMSEKEMVKVRENYNKALEKNYADVAAFVYPKGKLSDETRASLEAIDGVYISNSLTYQRYYPYREAYAHIVGYASTPNEDELAKLKEQGFTDVSIVGKTGIEAAYDSYLQPKSGFAYRLYNDDGSLERTLYKKSAVNGCDIYLTLNHSDQLSAYYLVASEFTSKQSGISITLDPSTGFLRSMISYPSFDPNIFSFPISDAEYQALTSAESLTPLYNRVTMGLYPPGSTIKPFTAVPALENDIVTKYTTFPYKVTKNAWTPSGVWYWDPVTRNETPDGPLNLDTALRFSDNIYFSWIAQKMGNDLFLNYMDSIGIGKAVPFDLKASKSNLVNENTEVNRKMLSDLSFGHGEMLVTPIQVASMYTCFRNNGDMLVPKVVGQIIRYDENDNEEIVYQAEREIYISHVMEAETLDTLISCLKHVASTGTAKSISTKGYTFAAKTGTALKGENKNLKLSWICAWHQDMDDELMSIVMIESPRKQNDRKLYIVKQLLTDN